MVPSFPASPRARHLIDDAEPLYDDMPPWREGAAPAAAAASNAAAAHANLRVTWRLAWRNAARDAIATAHHRTDAGPAPWTMLVSAGALFDDAGRVLLAQRPWGKNHATKWEFPGGKVELGESPERALARELVEELDVQVAEADLFPLAFSSFGSAKSHLLLTLYGARRWTRTPRGAEGQEVRWVDVNELGSPAYPMPQADVPMLPAVRAAMAAIAAGCSAAGAAEAAAAAGATAETVASLAAAAPRRCD